MTDEVETEESGDIPGDIEVSDHDDTETYDEVRAERSVVTDELDAHEEPVEHEAKEDDKDEPDKKEVKPEGKPAQPRGRFLEDGRYEVTRPDGTTFTLERDELPTASASRKRWYQTLNEQVGKAQQALTEQEQRHAAELEKLREEFGLKKNADKPWLEKGSSKPDIDAFTDVNQWEDAVHEWREAQKEPDTKAESAEDKQAIEQLNRAAMAVLEDGKERFPDFDDVVVNNAEAPFDPYMTSFLIAESEDAPAVFHYLGSHLDEAMHMRALLAAGDVKAAIRAIAKAEARIDQNDDSPSRSVPARDVPDLDAERPPARASRAPAPTRRVQGAAPKRVSPETEPIDSYIKRREKESLARL